MYIKILLNYLLGYVNIIVEGFFVERFINICMSKNIFLWKIKRDKSAIISANVGIQDFKNAVKIAKQTKCKIKIQSKKGMPFIFNKYKKRKIFVLLLLIIITSILVLSNFIWNIEITGNEKINADELKEIIIQEGLTIGKRKRDINTKEIINKMRLDRKDIAWIGIDLKGTNAIVKVIEADEKPEIINEDEYCNIVSDKEAMIIKVNAQNGTPQVKEGEIVKKGTVLIAGWLEGKYTGTRYVHANGEVMAKVWYTKKEEVLLNQVIEQETGIKENRYKLKINKFEINLFKRLPKFEKYDTIETEKKLKIFSNFYLPIELIQITYKEKLESQITYGIEEAKDIGRKKAEEELQNEINNTNVLQKYENAYVNSNSVTIELTYEVLENIGTKEKIVF